jgi:TonB-dependent SusC/RagA subfamily outer membrane receptor
MKKIVLVVFSVVSIITGCATSKVNNKSVVKSISPYNLNIAMPVSGATDDPVRIFTAKANVDRVFPNRDNIKALSVASVEITSSDPKKNLGLFRTVKVYMSNEDGSNEILLGSSMDVRSNTGNKLSLDLSRDVVAGYDGIIRPHRTSSYGTVEEEILAKVPGIILLPVREPGEPQGIRIRGTTTINSNAPLILINDIPATDLLSLSPNDIETVQVLKDASETGMYGARGANGVILIKTKNGDSVRENTATMNNFLTGSSVSVRFEYTLRYAVREQTPLHLTINFATISK